MYVGIELVGFAIIRSLFATPLRLAAAFDRARLLDLHVSSVIRHPHPPQPQPHFFLSLHLRLLSYWATVQFSSFFLPSALDFFAIGKKCFGFFCLDDGMGRVMEVRFWFLMIG